MSLARTRRVLLPKRQMRREREITAEATLLNTNRNSWIDVEYLDGTSPDDARCSLSRSAKKRLDASVGYNSVIIINERLIGCSKCEPLLINSCRVATLYHAFFFYVTSTKLTWKHITPVFSTHHRMRVVSVLWRRCSEIFTAFVSKPVCDNIAKSKICVTTTCCFLVWSQTVDCETKDLDRYHERVVRTYTLTQRHAWHTVRGWRCFAVYTLILPCSAFRDKNPTTLAVTFVFRPVLTYYRLNIICSNFARVKLIILPVMTPQLAPVLGRECQRLPASSLSPNKNWCENGDLYFFGGVSPFLCMFSVVNWYVHSAFCGACVHWFSTSRTLACAVFLMSQFALLFRSALFDRTFRSHQAVSQGSDDVESAHSPNYARPTRFISVSHFITAYNAAVTSPWWRRRIY